jgi:hypothetical protein
MEWLGKPRHRREGRRLSERDSAKSNLLAEADQKKIRDVSTSLDMTKSEGCAVLIDLVRRNLEPVAVGIAKINRVRNFMILEFEFDSALL